MGSANNKAAGPSSTSGGKNQNPGGASSPLNACTIPRSPEEFFKPERDLLWLDVSFNQLASIHASVCECKSLRTLYLHGNQLHNLAHVERLAKLSDLSGLTTNGNPFEAKDGYRLFCIGALPGIRKLDHTNITKEEKYKAIGWYKRYCESRAEAQVRKREAAELRAAQGY